MTCVVPENRLGSPRSKMLVTYLPLLKSFFVVGVFTNFYRPQIELDCIMYKRPVFSSSSHFLFVKIVLSMYQVVMKRVSQYELKISRQGVADCRDLWFTLVTCPFSDLFQRDLKFFNYKFNDCIFGRRMNWTFSFHHSGYIHLSLDFQFCSLP